MSVSEKKTKPKDWTEVAARGIRENPIGDIIVKLSQSNILYHT